MRKCKKPDGLLKKGAIYLLVPLFSLLLFCNFVLAQDEESSDDNTFTMEEIVVTGSRIRTNGMETPTPVTVVEMQEVDVISPSAVVDGLAELPQFYGSNTTETGNTGFWQGSGQGNLNLRGLGDKRTLQLLDGRRVVPSSIFGGPDVNLFPEYLLRTVETVTGGASAAYGTDAVSGVVNFILNTDYEGVKGRVQYGTNEKGHGDTHDYAIAGGWELKNGLHLLLSAEKSSREAIAGSQITEYDWYDEGAMLSNPDPNAGDSINNPLYLRYPQVRSFIGNEDGVFNLGGTIGRYGVNADGSVFPWVMGEHCSAGACSTINYGSGIDSNQTFVTMSPQYERDNYYGYVDYDITTKLQVYGQFIKGHTESTSYNVGGSFLGGRDITIYSGNPFLPDDIQQLMDDNNLASVKFDRVGSREDLGEISYNTMETDTESYTAGAKYNVTGGYFDGWQVKSYYQYGETTMHRVQKGGVRLDRVYLALDVVTDPVTGLPACNVTATSGLYPDCVPLNLFGRGNASPEAVNWVTDFEPGADILAHGYLDENSYLSHHYINGPYKQRVLNINQHVFEISADGDIFEGWGAGPIKGSLGYNYRTEFFEQFVEVGPGGNIDDDPFALPVMANNAALGIRGVPGGSAASGNSVEIQFSKCPYATGSQDVHEAFGEILIPILSDLPAVKQLNASGAYRWAKYSGSGDTESWKAGADWTIMNGLRLRGTLSQDVRAATIGEKYDRTGGIAFIRDSGIDPNKPASTIKVPTTFSNGSPDIKPEKAKTQTFGVVYVPDWLRGLSLSVDWYSVRVTDNITQMGAQAVVDGCYLDHDQQLCNSIIRTGTPTTDYLGNPINNISLIGTPYFNQNSIKATGIEFEIGYNRPVDWLGGGESIGLRFIGSYLSERSMTTAREYNDDGSLKAGTGATTEYQGWAGYPEFQGTLIGTYRRGGLGFAMTARYTDEYGWARTTNQPDATTGEITYQVGDNTIDAKTYFDARLNYRFDFDKWNMTLFLNVNNLFDKGPEYTYTTGEFSPTAALTPNPGLGVTGDTRGRRYTFGFSFEY